MAISSKNGGVRMDRQTASDSIAEALSGQQKAPRKAYQLEETRTENYTLDDVSQIYVKSKKPLGVQKSVYLEKEVHEFVQRIAEENGLKYSSALNILLKKLMK